MTKLLPTAADVARCIPIKSSRTEVAVRGQALDAVLWAGEQWAVTTFGIEARDGTYAIDAGRLREDEPGYSWQRHMSEKTWVNHREFQVAFAIACWVHRGEPFHLPAWGSPEPGPLRLTAGEDSMLRAMTLGGTDHRQRADHARPGAP